LGDFRHSEPFGSFVIERINTAQQKDGLNYFLMLNGLEAKIFQYGFLEGHNV